MVLNGKEREATGSLKALQGQTNDIRLQYEAHISKLEERLRNAEKGEILRWLCDDFLFVFLYLTFRKRRASRQSARLDHSFERQVMCRSIGIDAQLC